MRRKAVFVSAISFDMGFLALSSQVLLLREFLTVYSGNELSLGVIFAAWFLSIFAGAAVSSRRRAGAPPAPGWLALGASAPGAALILQILSIRACRPLLGVAQGGIPPLSNTLFFSLLFGTASSFLIGYLFPLMCRLSSAASGTAGAVRRVYISEAAGSLLSGVVLTFVLIPRLSNLEAAFVVFTTGLWITSAAGAFLAEGLRKRQLWTVFMALATALVFLSTTAADELDSRSNVWKWRSYSKEMRLLFSKDSRYENIALVTLEDQYSLFLDGFYAESFPDPYRYSQTANLVLLEHPAPRTMLVAGLGATGFLRQALTHPIERIDYVEFDQDLVKWVEPYLPEEDRLALENDRISIHFKDIRAFVREAPEREYDLVFLNFPDPTTAFLNRAYTVEFYRSVARTLRRKGLLIAQLSSNENYFSKELLNYTGSVFGALKAVFPFVEIIPGETYYFLCSFEEGVGTLDPEILRQRFEKREVKSDFNPYALYGRFNPERIAFAKKVLASTSETAPNSDRRPSSYFLALALWAKYSSGRLSGVLNAFARVRPVFFLYGFAAALAAYLAVVFTCRRRLEPGFNTLFSIATTGLSGMAWNIILLLSFQSLLGYMYQHVGLLTALFMLGIAAGGSVWKARGDPLKQLVITESIVVLNAVLLFLHFRLFGFLAPRSPRVSEFAIFALMFLSGFATGLEFVPAARVMAAFGRPLRNASGLVDAFDHLGAAFGALLASLLLIPVLGSDQAALVLVELNALSLLLWLIFLRLRPKRPGP